MKNVMVGFTKNTPRNINRVVLTNFSCSVYNSGSVNYIGANFNNREILNKPPEGFLHTPKFDEKYDIFQVGLVIWNLFCRSSSGPYCYSKNDMNVIKKYRDKKLSTDNVIPCLINVYMTNHGVPEIQDIEHICQHDVWLKNEFLVKRKNLAKTSFIPKFRYFKAKNQLIGDLLEDMLEFLPKNRIDAKTALSRFQENVTDAKITSIDIDEFTEKSKFYYSSDRADNSEDFLKKFFIMQTVKKISSYEDFDGFSTDEIESFFRNQFSYLFPYNYDIDQFCDFYQDFSNKEIFEYWKDGFFGEINVLENKYAIQTDKLVKEFKDDFKMENWFDLDNLINWHGKKLPFGMDDIN